MKRLITVLMLVASMVIFCGCGTNTEQVLTATAEAESVTEATSAIDSADTVEPTDEISWPDNPLVDLIYKPDYLTGLEVTSSVKRRINLKFDEISVDDWKDYRETMRTDYGWTMVEMSNDDYFMAETDDSKIRIMMQRCSTDDGVTTLAIFDFTRGE